MHSDLLSSYLELYLYRSLLISSDYLLKIPVTPEKQKGMKPKIKTNILI